MNESSSKRAGAALLKGADLRKRRRGLDARWRLRAGRRLERQFEFADFHGALAFTNKVGALAEKAGHHPDIHLAWGKVRLVIWTHSLGGLSEADFALAEMIGKPAK